MLILNYTRDDSGVLVITYANAHCRNHKIRSYGLDIPGQNGTKVDKDGQDQVVGGFELATPGAGADQKIVRNLLTGAMRQVSMGISVGHTRGIKYSLPVRLGDLLNNNGQLAVVNDKKHNI